MKFNIGDHSQEIGSYSHGIVIKYDEQNLKPGLSQRGQSSK